MRHESKGSLFCLFCSHFMMTDIRVRRKDNMDEAEANSVSKRGTGIQGECMSKVAGRLVDLVV